MKGRWNQLYFKNDDPIVLELGCGRADYTIALAQKFPQINFIGVDAKGERLWQAAKNAIENSLNNTAFLRCLIERIPNYFDKNEIHEIWITFPDPFIKKSKAKKRLTSHRFLKLYQQILKSNNLIHLKTDDETLFNHTLETIESEKYILHKAANDLYSDSRLSSNDLLTIKTTYEKRYLERGRKIKYACFSLSS